MRNGVKITQIVHIGECMKKEVLAIIPARGSKDELDHMNIRELGGKPLINYTIKAALSSKIINRVIVSTENEEVNKVALDENAEVPFLRPDYLCNGDTTLVDVVSYTLEKLESSEGYTCDYVVVLLPNTPFKSSEDIDSMIEFLIDQDLDSIISLSQINEFIWKFDGNDLIPGNFSHRKKRMEAESRYIEKGGIYIYKRSVIINPGKYNLGERIGHYIVSPHNAQTIHTMYDFFVLERLVKLPVALLKKISEFD